MQNELEPCPFCGCGDVRKSEKDYITETLYYVYCFDCMAKSDECGDIEDAIVKWNKRAVPDELKNCWNCGFKEEQIGMQLGYCTKIKRPATVLGYLPCEGEFWKKRVKNG